MRTFFFLALISFSLHAQTFSPGSYSKSLHSQLAVVQDGAGSLFTNPAMLAYTPSKSFWFSFAHPFQMREITGSAIAGSLKFESFAIGFGGWQLGHALYQEQLYSLAVTLKTGDFSLAINPKQRRIQIQNYGVYNQFLLNLGAFYPINRTVAFGTFLKNISATKIGDSDESVPRELFAGLRVTTGQQLTIFTELNQHANFDPQFRLAADYQPHHMLSLQFGSGFNTETSFSSGVRFSFSQFQLNYAFEQHPALDYTHTFGFNWGQ